jgi:hypothetical protein
VTAATTAPVPRQDAPCPHRSQDAPLAPTAPLAARVRAVAALLATAYIRTLLPDANPLALSPESEPSCGDAVGAPGAPGRGRDGESL